MRIEWLLVSCCVLVGFVPFATAHAPAEPQEPDPNYRTLFLRHAQVDKENASTQPGGYPYERQVDEGYSLGADVNGSESAVHSFYDDGLFQCISYCAYPGLSASAPVVGEDFQVDTQKEVFGTLHVAWQTYRSTPDIPPMYRGNAAFLMVDVYFGETFVGCGFQALGPDGGDLRVPITACEHECEHQDENGTHSGPCEDSEAPTEEVWAHDVRLELTIEHWRDSLDQPLGSQTDVKVDAAGGSFLAIAQVPQPVLQTVELSIASEDVPIDEVYQVEFNDQDGDGEPEVQYVPGASPLLVLGALGGLVALLRRRL